MRIPDTSLKILLLLTVSLLAVACTRTADDFEVWGLDVSRHQKDVDWEKVLQHEQPHFVFIKATEGTLIVDPTYAKHRAERGDTVDERFETLSDEAWQGAGA